MYAKYETPCTIVSVHCAVYTLVLKGASFHRNSEKLDYFKTSSPPESKKDSYFSYQEVLFIVGMKPLRTVPLYRMRLSNAALSIHKNYQPEISLFKTVLQEQMSLLDYCTRRTWKVLAENYLIVLFDCTKINWNVCWERTPFLHLWECHFIWIKKMRVLESAAATLTFHESIHFPCHAKPELGAVVKIGYFQGLVSKNLWQNINFSLSDK